MFAYFRKTDGLAALVRAQFRSTFDVAGTDPVDYPFAASDIAQLHRIRRDPGAQSVDAQTWTGLLLDAYFARLTGQASIFGKQVLHHRLIDGLGDAARQRLAERVRALLADPSQLEQLHRACRPLRHADTDIASLLFEDSLPAVPDWAGRTWLLFAGLAACVAAVVLTPLAWLGAGYFLYQLVSIQMRYVDRIAAWDRSMKSVQMMLRTSSLLGELGAGPPDFLLDEFADTASLSGKINRSLSRLPEVIPGSRAYLDWFLLANAEHYFKSVARVALHRDFLRACYLRCANLEADIALAQHLLEASSFSWAHCSDSSVIELDGAVHPLLAQPAALSIALQGKGGFISGQNGIGKSTLLRTVGLNLVVARAFGFCYASRANVPMLPVLASMQSEDSLLGGESLYIAELARAKELLAMTQCGQRATYIIDEIFRGTNHLESVSAAAAVLDVLASNDTVIVSSHNLVLASLLEHRLAPFCVALDEDGVLTLAPGLLAHTNGIALLARRGFGPQVEANAAKVFDWLSAYLAQPGGGGAVLGAMHEDEMRRRCGKPDLSIGVA
ncbi:MutS-related protein [Massilia psychrophila]|uniref:DNA mismatch repair protein MutS n=1 Tax=Massilia psychrophila TaxID=1603353 RepID=A0A2G8SWA7_9BURK|nr:hypothetical protein [Massilia psychrophila]PIL37983.1 hypothetical protein CR103_20550 [Massilia psychrophila]GGE71161.1 DNA mismatch repair protein MutS [Massilia psychrophila]